MDNIKDSAAGKMFGSLALKDGNFKRSYVLQKMERLAAALFVVSDFLDQKDSLRELLRTHATGALLHTVSFVLACGARGQLPRRENERSAVMENLLKIITLCELMLRGGGVSAMNFSILQNEFAQLADHIFSYEKKEDSFAQAFAPEIATDERASSPHAHLYGSVIDRDDHKGHLKGQQSIGQSKGHTTPQARGVGKRTFFLSDARRGTDDKKAKRIEEILRTIRQKGSITIKDVSHHLLEYSEKTLQRELLTLVAKGVLKKEGERRWSRYSLSTA